MIVPSNRLRIMVATKPIDFRKGHDSLAAMVKNELRKDPFTGTVFVFRAKKADRLKLLYWDGTGLVMAYKRLEEHTFTALRLCLLLQRWRRHYITVRDFAEGRSYHVNFLATLIGQVLRNVEDFES